MSALEAAASAPRKFLGAVGRVDTALVDSVTLRKFQRVTSAKTNEMSTTPNNNTNSNSKNILNSDVEVKGAIKFSGELTFDGKLEGDISSEGTLNLGENAVVKGTIDVGSVVVRGKITGNIIAKDKIDLKAKTELFGDVRASKLVMEEGVTFVGKTEVNPNKVSATPVANRGEAPKVAPPKAPGL